MIYSINVAIICIGSGWYLIRLSDLKTKISELCRSATLLKVLHDALEPVDHTLRPVTLVRLGEHRVSQLTPDVDQLMVFIEELCDLSLRESSLPAFVEHVLIPVGLAGNYRSGRSRSCSHQLLLVLLLHALKEVRRLIER